MVFEGATSYRWLRTGDEAFAAMLSEIQAAQFSLRLESYIYRASPIGEQIRDALITACKRGVAVQVLVDAFGSLYLTDAFWVPLCKCGAIVRWFNPLSLHRFSFRNHRKLLVADERVAIVGGFNIAPEYQGDGVNQGWCDLGLRLAGPLASELANSFDAMLSLAEFRHQRLWRLRRPKVPARVATHQGVILQTGPGRGRISLKRALRKDLRRAQSAKIMTAYFLPTWRIRHELLRMGRRGAKVQLLLAGKSDVPLSQLACQRLYQPMLKAGIEIYEYQPQILHAKLIIIDHWVYVGSANLDIRSLRLNYELMLRLGSAELAKGARSIFLEALTHSRRIDPDAWAASRSLWRKLREYWAFFLLARLDPYLVRRQRRNLR